jgi:hypothetical protein
MIKVFLAILAASWLLLSPHTAFAKDALVVLVPGGKNTSHGPNSFLARNAHKFKSAGYQVYIADTAQQAFAALVKAKSNGQPTYLVGMSVGSIKSAAVLGKGFRPDAVVLFSANYEKVKSLIGTPKGLPPMLLVHHVKDKCPGTTPVNVEPFKKWAGQQVQIYWVKTSGSEQGDSCGLQGGHGFYGKDNEPIGAALGFLKKH